MAARDGDGGAAVSGVAATVAVDAVRLRGGIYKFGGYDGIAALLAIREVLQKDLGLRSEAGGALAERVVLEAMSIVGQMSSMGGRTSAALYWKQLSQMRSRSSLNSRLLL